MTRMPGGRFGRAARPNTDMLRTRLIVSLVAAVMLAGVDHRYAVVDRAAPLVNLVLLPITKAATLPADLFEWVSRHYRGVQELTEENREIRRQLLENSFRVEALDALKKENQRLRALARLEIEEGERKTRVAEVTKDNTHAFRQTIAVNRGSRDDVYVGQPVMDERGIVGQITATGLFQSTVLLITDVSHALLARNARTGDRYLAHGNGQGLTLRYVPRHNDLEPGDILLTSGLDDTYPGQHMVGRVTRVTAQPGRDFLEADVQAAAQLHRNREVLLVWYRKPARGADHAD